MTETLFDSDLAEHEHRQQNTKKKKPFIVEQYNAGADTYTIAYYKDGAKQCVFNGKRDNRNGVFYLHLEYRCSYGTVPNVRRVFFDECTWEI